MRWLASFDERKLWGCLFLSIGSVFFVGYFFVAVISKLLPPSHVPLISAVQNDCCCVVSYALMIASVLYRVFREHVIHDTRYYCFLVPLTLPIIVVAVYFHWLSMKLFKHA